MVGEGHERGGVDAQLAQRRLEAGRRRDAGEGQHPRSGQLAQAMGAHALGLPALDRAVTRDQHGHAGSVDLRSRAHLGEVRLCPGAGGHDQMRARER